MQETNLQNLVINKVESQEVYDALNTNGAINDNELYLVGGDSSVDSVNGQTGDVNLDIPVVHKVESQDAYDEMVTAGQINDGELYLVQGDEYVQYTEQTLTEEQKAQARKNIEAEGPLYNWPSVTFTYEPYTDFPTTKTLYLAKGTLNPVDWNTADDELKQAWKSFLSVESNGFAGTQSAILQSLANIYLLCQRGVFGENFLTDGAEISERTIVCAKPNVTYGYNQCTGYLYINSYTAKGSTSLTVIYKRNEMKSQSIRYDCQKKKIDFGDYITYLRATSIGATNIDTQPPSIEQTPMKSEPTEDMHIATKKYVDDKVTDKELILTSSTENSTKKFKITVDDSGTLTATEVS